MGVMEPAEQEEAAEVENRNVTKVGTRRRRRRQPTRLGSALTVQLLAEGVGAVQQDVGLRVDRLQLLQRRLPPTDALRRHTRARRDEDARKRTRTLRRTLAHMHS